MLKKLFFVAVVFCLLVVSVQAQETTFTPFATIEVQGLARLSSGSVSLSPDGTLLAVIFGTQPTGDPSPDGYNGVILYDTGTGQPVATLDLFGAMTTAFSLDGTMFAVSGNSTVVFDLPKLFEIKTVNEENALQAFESGVLRNAIEGAQRSYQLGFLPDNRTLYTVDTAHKLWDISTPTDLSNLDNIPSPSFVMLPIPEGSDILLNSFVSGEAGAFAAVVEGEGVMNYSIVSIDSDGAVTVIGQPALGTGQAIPYVSLDGSLMTLAEPFEVQESSIEGRTLQTLRIRADDVPEPLFTQTIPQDSTFSIAPNGLYGVFSTVVDGHPVAQFYATETGETVGTLPIDSIDTTEIILSANNRLALVDTDAKGNGLIRVFEADGLNFGLNVTEVGNADALSMGFNLPSLTEPEDCETDSESITGETRESTCDLSSGALTLDTPLTLTKDATSISLTYPSAMVIDQPSKNAIILATSQTVLEKDFSIVPTMDTNEAAISIALTTLDELAIEQVEGMESARQVMEGFVEFLKEVDLTLDGAIIDTFAGEYSAAAAYFTNASGDVLIITAQVTPDLYVVFIVISAPYEIALIESTVYDMANTLTSPE